MCKYTAGKYEDGGGTRPEMTELDMQIALYHYRWRHGSYPLMFPNVYHYDWESDLLYVSKDGYLTEYEIKLSHSDFVADMKKKKKHTRLNGTVDCPKYFYYVCPENIIALSEIPQYAGLIYVTPKQGYYKYHNVGVIKDAPILVSDKIDQERMELLYRKILYKYWDAVV